MSQKVKTIYATGEKEKENQKPKKPGIIKTGTEKPKVKITGPGAKVVAALLVFFCLIGDLIAQPGVIPQPGTQASVFTNRLLTTIASSGVTNRLYFTNASAAFGPTNSIHVRSNASTQKWEWHTTFATVVATNDNNRPTGTWRTITVSPTVYGYTRYEPRSPQTLPDAPASAANNPRFVQVDTNGVVVIPENFWDANSGSIPGGSGSGSTNQYLANPTLTNATFQGPANFASVYATNMAGNGSGLTNVAITNVVSGNADNNFRAGGNATIFGAGNNNNVSLGGSGGEINNSIYSLLAVPNLGGATIENCQTCAIITANEATIFNSQQSVIVGGQHIGIGGAGGGLDGHNAIIGGNNIYIGDQFSSDVFFANSAAGGEFIYHFDGTSRSGSVGGERLYFYAVTNGFAVGSSNRLSGYGPMAIGSLLTNSQNHEVMLGRYGSEVRIKTNGVTSLKKIEFEGGTSSGNITNTSSWQIGLAGSAVSTLYTNGSRRGTIYFTGQSGEFGAMVATSLVTYNQGGSNTNEWGKTTIYDTGDIPGYISVSGPVNPNQVYYINPYGTTLTTESFRIVYE
jgi:hypothetical protein